MINNSKYRRRVINGNTADIKPTDVQMKEMERFISLLKNIKNGDHDNNNSNKSTNDDEDYEIESENFDILSKVRVIFHQGRVLKKAMHSLVSHNSKRYLCLLNDYLLICSVHGSSHILSSQEKYSINQNTKL
jgi:hypothetical protein